MPREANPNSASMVALEMNERANALPPEQWPQAKNADSGVKESEDIADRSLPAAAKMLARIALSPQSNARLHTRVAAIQLLVRLSSKQAEEPPEADNHKSGDE